MRIVAEREISRLNGDQKRIESESTSLSERLSQLEGNLFRDKSKLEQITQEINWDEKTRSDWLAKQSKQEDDRLRIEKYAREDEARIKTLSLQMEKLESEARESRRQLEDEVTDTISQFCATNTSVLRILAT